MSRNRHLFGMLFLVAAIHGGGCNDSPDFWPVPMIGLDADAGAGEVGPFLDIDAERDLGPGPGSPTDVADVPNDSGTGTDLPQDADAPQDAPQDGDAPEDVAADTDAPRDADADASDHVDTDTRDIVAEIDDDVPRPPGCGDGLVDLGEECDDGNDIDEDECSNACVAARCGDGILNATLGNETFLSPLVTDPSGAEGYVCDDGATCPAAIGTTTCETADRPNAPEHGICQALGFDLAVEVTWGGGLGEGSSPMPHASNWECFDYTCSAGPFQTTASNCATDEMLAEIVCEGIVGEECDDGDANGDLADACRLDCTLPTCGDAIIDSDEECDDGNDIDDDGCSNNCLLPQCGDGVTQDSEGEECDDADDDDTNDCRNDCSLPSCGDGVRSHFFAEETFTSPVVTGPTGATGRVCDDGASCWGSTCVVEDDPSAPEHGICQALGYEICIEVQWGGGEGESDSSMPHAYNWTCVDYVCGPSTNTYDSDNCGASEMLNTIRCAGGYSEDCDEGDSNADIPGATCRTDCTLPRCGDGVYEPARGEECDDGNDVANDGCSNTCRLPRCGDALVQGDEECDDGNDVDTDACRNDCTPQVCGDGFLADAEDCDEGELNADEPDAICRTDCTNPRCGDGIIDSDEECDDGNHLESDLCLNTCEEARCGDGIRHRLLGEECDDGNRIDDDECANDCTGEIPGFGCADEDLRSDVGEPVATGTTAGRSADYRATCAAGASAPDISFNWIAPSTGIYEINTNGSLYDTSLHIHTLPDTPTGDVCRDAPQLACDDDAGEGLNSLINLDAEMGREYLIVVDGYSSSSGDFVLNIIPR